MKKVTTAQAIWQDRYWKVNVQHEGVRKSFYDSTPGRRGKALCEAKAIEWLNGLMEDNPKFSHAWDEFLADRKRSVEQARLNNLECVGRKWFLPTFGEAKLSSISPIRVQRLADAMADAGDAASTIKGRIALLKQFGEFCKKSRYRFEIPEGVEIRGAKSAARTILRREDILKVFRSSETMMNGKTTDEFYIHAFRMALVSGVRRGELVGLQWSDVDEAAGKIWINRAVNSIRAITGGKTENARRFIPLSESIRKILADQKAMLAGMGIISEWIFPSDVNRGAAAPATVLSRWKRFLSHQGIPDHTFHEIRHTMISLNATAIPEEWLKRVVGHSEKMDTFGTYGHELEGEAAETARIMDEVMRKLLA